MEGNKQRRRGFFAYLEYFCGISKSDWLIWYAGEGVD